MSTTTNSDDEESEPSEDIPMDISQSQPVRSFQQMFIPKEVPATTVADPSKPRVVWQFERLSDAQLYARAAAAKPPLEKILCPELADSFPTHHMYHV